MFPQTLEGEIDHRRHKRELEISTIIEAIQAHLNGAGSHQKNPLQILEFGSGDGFQIPYLKKLGEVAAIDIRLSDSVKKTENVEAHECSITHTPFSGKRFDIIFSNHVLEHIESLPEAFKELKRIGNADCLYAFSVPTDFWLLMSIPAQYYNKVKTLFKKSGRSSQTQKSGEKTKIGPQKKSILSSLGVRGHGVRENFWDCWTHFRIQEWKKLLTENGFEILKVQPLLLYGPSEWPIIPTLKVQDKANLCSSVLFLSKNPISTYRA